VYRKAGISEAAGDMKAKSHLGRRYLKGTAGDAANAILTAVCHNFRLVLAWLRILLCLILATLRSAIMARSASKLASLRRTICKNPGQ
jgi:IS5 family transposase